MPPTQSQSLGERRVAVRSNPSGSSEIAGIKLRTAAIINIVLEIPNGNGPDADEIARLKELAATAYEEAEMWAVKAIKAAEAAEK